MLQVSTPCRYFVNLSELYEKYLNAENLNEV